MPGVGNGLVRNSASSERGEAMASKPDTTVNGKPDPRVERVEQLESGTVEAIYDLTKEAPERQISSSSSLDAKMVQIFGAASIVMGFLGLSSSTDLIQGRLWMLLLIIGALVCYGCTAVLAFIHLGPKEFWRNLGVDRWLSPRYLNLDEDEFRRLVIVDTGRAYSHNGQILKEKARYVRYALALAGLEVFLVVVTLILSRAT